MLFEWIKKINNNKDDERKNLLHSFSDFHLLFNEVSERERERKKERERERERGRERVRERREREMKSEWIMN